MQFQRTINSMKDIQETNRTTVLRVLFSNNAPMTRGEIAARTGLSAPTITRIIKDLIKAKVVVEAGKVELMQGRNRELLQIDYEHIHVLGFEVNESSVHGIVSDLKGEVKMGFSEPVTRKDPASITATIQGILDQIAQSREDLQNVIGIGLAISGIVSQSEQKVLYSSVMGWENIHVRDLFPDADDLTVVVENDANAALLGEVWLANNGDSQDDIAYIVIGEGVVGASLLVNGQLARGSSLVAGEISHFPVQPKGKLCVCGNFGCLETYVSLQRLEQEYGELSGKSLKLIDAFKMGDPLARTFVVEAAEKVASVICSIAYLINPEKIIIGGLWIEAGETFLRLITEKVKHDFALEDRHIPQIVYSKLHPHAGVLGAVGLVIDEYLKY